VVPLTIGMLADDLGVSVDTVRYYERRGLLPEPRRTDSGYRSYADEDRRTLAFILRAKEHGFTLKEIAGLLAHVGDGMDDAPAAVRAAAAAKLEDLREQRRELDSIESRLERLLRLCDDGDAENCASLVEDPCRA
jgi:MerR family transcriptional regulator, mercuric resistance operon regulatory protein